ncbi:MAG TPA: guanylate kinase [Chitinophagales bacterium]|nr:guanylate kinase [Chitinophagales bacterium]
MSGHSFTRVLIPPKKLIIITAPSGAGKSTIVRKLLKHHPNVVFSVSCTTREKRTGEEHGDHYYFLGVDEFKRKVAAGDFVEHEEVYPGKFYGTLKAELERIWNQRKVVIFDIDVKGALNLKKQFGNDCLTIFIAPPSKESLVNRLKNRGTEDEKSLKARIKRSEEELTYADKFDKIVVNHDFDTAYMRTKNHITNFLKPQTVHVH